MPKLHATHEHWIARAAFGLLLAVTLLSKRPGPTFACTGAPFPFAMAATRADSIYYVTVRTASGDSNGFYAVDVTYGATYRGTAQTHVERVVAGEPCTYAIEPDQSGILLLGVDRPFGGPVGTSGNLFYLVGPSGISYRDAIITLHNLPPPTDTADPIARTAVGQSGLAVLAAGLIAFVVLLWRRRPRPV
jgi:hypothetical protein